MPRLTNHYAILGIAPTATEDEVKKAYRRLALIHHPDKNRDDENATETFRTIKESYELLIDPTQRKRYDSDCKKYGVKKADEYPVYGSPPKTRGESHNAEDDECERLQREAAERVQAGREQLKKEAAERRRAERWARWEAREQRQAEREEAERAETRRQEAKRAEARARRRQAEREEAERRESERREAERREEKIREEERKEAKLKEALRKQAEETKRRKELEKRQRELEETVHKLTETVMQMMKNQTTHGFQNQPIEKSGYSPSSVVRSRRRGGTWWLEEEEDYLVELRERGLGWGEIEVKLNKKFGRDRSAGACSSKWYRLQY